MLVQTLLVTRPVKKYVTFSRTLKFYSYVLSLKTFCVFYFTKYAFVAIIFKWLVEDTCFSLHTAPLPV